MSLLGKWFGFGRDEIYDEALRAYDQGAYEDAVEAFQECLEKASDPTMVRLAKFYLSESHAQLGRANLRAENFSVAIENFESAIELSPHYPDLHMGLCRAHRALENLDEQRAELAEALRLNPMYAEAVLMDGIVMMEEGHSDRGLKRIAEAIALDPTLDTDRYRFALKCVEEGDMARAKANFVAMTASGVNDANLHARVAETFIRQRMFEEAAQELRNALSISPNYADIRCRYGQILLELDQVEQAAEELRQAIEINPKYAEAHAQLGIALKRMRKEREAKAEFKRVLELNPDHSIAQMEVGRI